MTKNGVGLWIKLGGGQEIYIIYSFKHKFKKNSNNNNLHLADQCQDF